MSEGTRGAGGGRPTVICITPIKNEAWVLERFIRCASRWADRIIIADQRSTDGSREIIARYPHVTLVDNNSTEYSEHIRQNLLLAEARKTPGKRLIFSLDADEVISANWEGHPEWGRLLALPEGTVIRFPKAELHPDFGTYWEVDGSDLVHGFVDDGSPFHGIKAHGPRLPMPEPLRRVRPESLWLLHYRYTDPLRNLGKQRWNQCWERLTFPEKRAVTIVRQCNMDLNIPPDRPRVRDEWFAGYERLGIPMRRVEPERHSWWDKETVRLFSEHGVERFRRLDVFDGSWWAGMPDFDGVRVTAEWPYDPRGGFERRFHRWMRKTQAVRMRWWVRLLQRSLIPFGW